MSEIKLLPCPFCGGEAELVGDKYHWVLCKDCKGGSHAFENVEEAIEKWNQRKPMQEIIERLEEELDYSIHNFKEDEVIYRKGIRFVRRVIKEVGEING